MTNLLMAAIMGISAVVARENRIELLFAGDAMQHQAQLDAARIRGQPSLNSDSYDYSDCFRDIAPLVSEADYAVVNLETPVGMKGPYSGYPCFYAPAGFAKALQDAGFDMMLTANNHTLDRHSRGLRSTISVLDSLRIPHLGTYSDMAARQRSVPYFFRVKEVSMAILNYTYGTNGIAPDGGVVVDYIGRAKMKADIDSARAGGAKVIIAAVHWGDEYQLLPNAGQKSLARFLVDQGVDLVIGSHPHVIQPMEMVWGSRHDKKALVVYSLGNFISNMKTRDTRGGAFVRVYLQRLPDGSVRLEDATWQLHFTVPAGNGRNFHVMPADSVDVPAWRGHRDNFVRAATGIFHKHNRQVREHGKSQ